MSENNKEMCIAFLRFAKLWKIEESEKINQMPYGEERKKYFTSVSKKTDEHLYELFIKKTKK